MQLLGELYADKKYLEKLMDDQGKITNFIDKEIVKGNKNSERHYHLKVASCDLGQD